MALYSGRLAGPRGGGVAFVDGLVKAVISASDHDPNYSLRLAHAEKGTVRRLLKVIIFLDLPLNIIKIPES